MITLWPKMFVNFRSELQSIDFFLLRQDNFHLPELEYMDFQPIPLDESSNEMPSPTKSEESFVHSPVKNKVIGDDQARHSGASDLLQGNQVNDRNRAPVFGTSTMAPSRQSVIQANPNRISTSAIKTPSANGSLQPTSNTTHRSVDVKSLRDERAIDRMLVDPKRERMLDESSSASARPTDQIERNKRPESPVEHTAQVVRSKEQSAQGKKISPKDCSDSNIIQAAVLPSSAGNHDFSTTSRSTLASATNNRAAIIMATQIQNSSAQNQKPPTFTDEKFNPEPSSSAKVSSASTGSAPSSNSNSDATMVSTKNAVPTGMAARIQERKRSTFSNEKRSAQFEQMPSTSAMSNANKTVSFQNLKPPITTSASSVQRQKPSPFIDEKQSVPFNPQANAEIREPESSQSSANRCSRSSSSSSWTQAEPDRPSNESSHDFDFSEDPNFGTENISPSLQISGHDHKKSRKRNFSNKMKKTNENADFKKPKTSLAPDQGANNDSLFGDALFLNVDRPIDDFEFKFDDGPVDMAANFNDQVFAAPNIDNESGFNFDFLGADEPFVSNAGGDNVLNSPDVRQFS